jgi:hypothetical protein
MKKKTLEAGDIATIRAIGRRSALATIGALALGTAATAHARSPSGTKTSDSDPTDPPGHGRTGFTDRDSGSTADGAGRGVCPERGWSDSDPNDPRGRGRGPCH